jgi:type IV pilus assembly protein PilN
MANINLLPWREERRQELKREFLVILGGVAVLGVAIIMLTQFFFSNAIDVQQDRNAYLQKHIDELNEQVKEIKELERKRNELLDRMNVISSLQGDRPLIVRIFDELVRTLPDGVFYKSLNRSGSNVKLQGIAESNNRISSLMRRLDGSDWFSSPNLSAVKAEPSYGDQASGFTMSYKISTPSNKKGGE